MSVHFLEPQFPLLGQTSHSSPLIAFLNFYPGVVKIAGLKPLRAGRINISDAFLISCDSALAGTLQQGGLKVNLSLLQKGKRKHQPPQHSLGLGGQAPAGPQPGGLLPEAGIYLPALPTRLAAKTKGPLSNRLNVPQVWGRHRRIYSYLRFILQSTGCLYRELNLPHFLQITKEKFHCSAGSWCSCLKLEGFKRARCSMIQLESWSLVPCGSLCHPDTTLAH